MWLVFATGFAEPILFLASIGIGVGKLVGTVPGPNGPLAYRDFVAPGLLAVTAMNGAILDTTYNFFVKFKYMHTYDAMLATPLGPSDVARGEVIWALLRGAIYGAVFLVTMVAFGVVSSWWGLLAVPVSVLVGWAFAGAGLGATTYMRSFLDFDFIALATIPMFLFSGTFFPLERYDGGLQLVVKCTPLYQGVVLERAVIVGDVHWSLLTHALYLATMGFIGVKVAASRLARLLQP